jgi:hypothetical protein
VPANGTKNLIPFQPGKSGNPGGRPKASVNLLEVTRTYTKEAVETLAKIMRNPKESGATRVSAANSLLDRAWGKPVQAIAAQDGESSITLHLIAAQLISKQLEPQDEPPTINAEPVNGHEVFDLNAPPPSE